MASQSQTLRGALRKHAGSILFFGIMAAGAFARLYRLGGPSLWYDELYTVRASTAPLGSVIPEALASRHPPFYYLALHFWSSLGSGDAWIRLLSALAGIITIGLVYGIGRNLFSRKAGLWAAALAAFSPFLVWYSRDATDYSWAIATTLASAFLLVRAARRGGWTNWGLYVVAAGAALFTHFYDVLFLAAEIPLFLLMKKPEGKIRPWLFCQAAIALILLPWVAALEWIKVSNRGAFSSLTIPSLGGVLDSMGTGPVTFFKGYAGLVGRGEAPLLLAGHDTAILAAGLLGAAVLLLAAYFFQRKNLRNLLALAVFSLLTIALPVILQRAQGTWFAGRYYAVAAPVFLLLVAALVSLLPSRAAWAAGGFIVLLMIIFLYHQNQGAYQENWRGIMSTISGRARNDDEILCFPLHQCVTAQGYYRLANSSNLPVRGGVITGDSSLNLFPSGYVWSGYRSRPPDVMAINNAAVLRQELDKRFKSTDRIWLVSGTGGIGNYPPATLVEAALAGEWQLQQTWDFTPISLKLYKKN